VSCAAEIGFRSVAVVEIEVVDCRGSSYWNTL